MPMPSMPPMPTRFRWTVVLGIILSVYIAVSFLAPYVDKMGWALKLPVTFFLTNIIFAMGRYALWRLGLVKPDDDEN